jgi:hypothetical protein
MSDDLRNLIKHALVAVVVLAIAVGIAAAFFFVANAIEGYVNLIDILTMEHK